MVRSSLVIEMSYNQARFTSTRPSIRHPADQGNRSSPVQHGPCASNLPKIESLKTSRRLRNASRSNRCTSCSFVSSAPCSGSTLSRMTHNRLSTIEVPVHLRSPGVMIPVQASAEPQPVPLRPCRAAPSRRSRTQGQEEAAAPLLHRECASPRSARWQEAG